MVFPLPEGPMRARTSPGLAEPVIPLRISFSVLLVTPLRITLYLTSENCKINERNVAARIPFSVAVNQRLLLELMDAQAYNFSLIIKLLCNTSIVNLLL